MDMPGRGSSSLLWPARISSSLKHEGWLCSLPGAFLGVLWGRMDPPGVFVPRHWL